MRESSAILRSCIVSRIAQEFFESELVGADSCAVLEALALEEAEEDFGQSFVTCPELPQKRQRFLSRQCCCS